MSLSKKHLKKKLLGLMALPDYSPLKQYQLAAAIGVRKSEMSAFRSLLRGLEGEGHIVRLRKSTYALPHAEDRVEGQLSVHQQGFGFVLRQTGDEEIDARDDVFIPKNLMKNARHGDKVLVAVNEDSPKGPEGRILEVLERGITRHAGTLLRKGRDWVILPDDVRIAKRVRVEGAADDIELKKGMKVAFDLVEATEPGGGDRAVVVEILGKPGEAGVDVLSIMRKFNLYDEFPERVMNEVEKIKPGLTNEALEKRRDCRSWLAFTIDPHDAKDHDDALSLVRNDEGNWELGIHIADVAHYVKPGSPLDEEALKRGNSAYLVDRVVPMLPNKLTTDLCSLVPYKDRLTHTVVIELSPKGKLLGAESFRSVIHSKAKLSYAQVQAYFDQGTTKGITKKVEASLNNLRNLTQHIRKERMKAGAMGFNVPEVRCQLNAAGKIKDIVKRVPAEAYNLVEECMLLANQVVAQIFINQERPSIFRVHEEPTDEQWAEMEELLRFYGIPEAPQSREDLNRIVKEVEEPAIQYAVIIAILRNMQRAMYTGDCHGHFGLAFDAYSHFTSPIRRYPDLIAHRILTTIEENSRSPYKKADIESLSLHCSTTERDAEAAEKETVLGKLLDHYAAKLLDGKPGAYPATVISIKPRGLIVEMEESLLKGLVPYPALLRPDYYVINEAQTTARGRTNKVMYRLGQPIVVSLAMVDTENKRIEFDEAANGNEKGQESGKR